MENVLAWLPSLMSGLWVSIQLTGLLCAIGIPLGLVLALGLSARNRLLNALALVTVEFCRGIPSLVLLYLVYFGLPQFNLVLEALPSAAIAFGISMAGFLADIFHAGLKAVPPGQHEAAVALGLNARTRFFRVILPQAGRIVTPPVLGYVISYFQATSLAFAIAVPELMNRANSLASNNFRFLELFALAGVLYAIISIGGQLLVDRVGKSNPTVRQ